MFWKKREKPQPTVSQKTEFPDGICVVTEKGSYYIKKGGRYKFFSDRARDSWALPSVLADFSAVAHMNLVSTLGFRDGTLIRDYGTGRTYLITQGKKLHITSPDTLDRYGMGDIKILDVSSEEAASHSDGGIFK